MDGAKELIERLGSGTRKSDQSRDTSCGGKNIKRGAEDVPETPQKR